MRRVIGIGSPFGSDRAAWQVIDRLRDKVPSDVTLTVLDRPGAALINWLRADDEVTLIDAACGDTTDLPYSLVEPAELVQTDPRLDTHRQQLASTLALARALGRLPRRLEIYAIHIVPDEILAAPNPVQTAPRELAEELIEKLAQGTSPLD